MYQRPIIRSNQKATVELFPFLSVLACTIGSLMLLIVLISSQAFSEEKEVTIIPRAEEQKTESKEPFYIELKEKGLILHPSREYVPIERAFNEGSAFMKLIREVENQKDKKYLILAVRPSGYEIFDRVRAEIEQRKIDLGYEPVNQNWKLDIQK